MQPFLWQKKRRNTHTHLRGRAQIKTCLQSWSGAVTHWYTNSHLDKYTHTHTLWRSHHSRIHTHIFPQTDPLTSHTHTQGSKQSLSLSLPCSLSCSPFLSLSLSPSHPHTQTTTVYQRVTSREPEGSAEMNVKILTLVIVLLVSLLCSASAGEYRSGQPCRQPFPFAFYFSLCLPWACAGSCSWSVTQHG